MSQEEFTEKTFRLNRRITNLHNKIRELDMEKKLIQDKQEDIYLIIERLDQECYDLLKKFNEPKTV